MKKDLFLVLKIAIHLKDGLLKQFIPIHWEGNPN